MSSPAAKNSSPN